jgi:hypothetical protein
LLLFSFLVFVVVPVEATGANWLTGWTYRKSHVINNATGAGTNYQVQIIVVNGSGADSGNTVYENNKAKNDWTDLRFTASDGSTLLYAWNETQNNGINITCWVKVSDDLSSAGVTIYLYYGNSASTSYWDLSNTFIRSIIGNVLAVPMDEGSGSTVVDKSGNGYTGTLHNSASFVSTPWGTGMNFSSTTSDYVDFGEVLNMTGDFTIDMWLYNRVNGSTRGFFGKKSGTSSEAGYMLGIFNTGKNYALRVGDGTNLASADDSAVGELSCWIHLVGEYNSTSKTDYTYKNGTKVGSTTNALLGSLFVKYNLRINDVGGSFTNFIADECHIYNRMLTNSEISDLYNNRGYSTPNYAGYVLVRKWVSSEPVHSTWGSEETSGDSAPPTYSSISANTTVAGALCSFNCLVNDDTNVSTYIFSTNNTGTWTNDSATTFSNFFNTTAAWANVTKTLNDAVGNVVSYLWYANDTSDNWSKTEQYNLTLTAPYRPNLQMTPDKVTCRKYLETFSIQINVTNAIDTKAFNFTIYYDPQVLNYSSVSWGELGTGTMTKIDTTNGILEGNVADSPITGNHWLLSITFQADKTIIWKDGLTNKLEGKIWFHQAELGFADGSILQCVEGGVNQIDVNEADYTFLPIRGDVNNDGTVDLFDLRAVAFYYDKTQADPVWAEASKYDLNSDNTIDIFDLDVVASNFWFTYP